MDDIRILNRLEDISACLSRIEEILNRDHPPVKSPVMIRIGGHEVPVDLDAKILRLLHDDRRLRAIKDVREVMGLSLNESIDLIKFYESQLAKGS